MITYFLGHLHPVLLHLPIGLFSVGMIAFYFHPDKSFRLSRQLNFMLLITGISSIISAITGWLLGHSGDYQEAAVRMHQWTAIAFTLLSAMVYFLHRYSLENNRIHPSFQPLLITSFLLMMYTGHEGGSLTHGDGFLWLEDQITSSSNGADTDNTKAETNNAQKNNEEKVNSSLPPIAPADSLSIKKLQEAGFVVKPVSAGSGWLDISAVSMLNLRKEQLQMLGGLSKNIYGLNLSDHSLNDDDVQVLKELENLKRLDVRNTGLTDRFLENISGLTNLDYFNLVGTNITDDGMKYIERMKGLRKVYCWKTKITIEAINVLKQKRPEIFLMVE